MFKANFNVVVPSPPSLAHYRLHHILQAQLVTHLHRHADLRIFLAHMILPTPQSMEVAMVAAIAAAMAVVMTRHSNLAIVVVVISPAMVALHIVHRENLMIAVALINQHAVL